MNWLNNKLGLYALHAFLAVAATTAFADENNFADCRQLFANNTPPVFQHQDDLKPRALCFAEFAVLHSGNRHTPIYVAERITKQALLASREIPRSNLFFEESRLPESERSTLADYQDAGFDRGHMAPAGDMGTIEAKAQSFSLANIVPQNPINNQHAWRKIEADTRKYSMRAEGDVFVITGPVFDGTPPTIGNNKVWVPQHLFKLVYDPSTGRAWAHWQDNTEDARPGKPISYEELVKRTGVDFFPWWGRN
ncbi:MAG: DNA/RNA non-specific endonuclease [Sideroxyarcus sp.]